MAEDDRAQNLSNFKNELMGCGPFLHDDPRDRPRSVFGGRTTLHIDPTAANHRADSDHPKEAVTEWQK